MALVFVFPFATYFAGEEIVEFSAKGATYKDTALTMVPFGIIVPVLMLLQVLIIFLYKNRPLQMRLGRLSYVLLLAMFATVYFQLDAVADQLPDPEKVRLDLGIAFFLPVGALIFTFLGNRAIKKDDEMVKSVDRLR